MKNFNLIVSNNVSRAKQCGVAAVEFALLLIPLLMIVAGIIEFGRTFWYYDALVKSTRDGARYLSNVRASTSIALDATLQDQAKNMVVDAVSAAQVPNFKKSNVAIVCAPDCTAPIYISVRINAYPVVIGGWIPILTTTGATTWGVSLSPSTSMRYMR